MAHVSFQAFNFVSLGRIKSSVTFQMKSFQPAVSAKTKHFVPLSLILGLYLLHAAAVSFPIFPSQVAISANICEITCLSHTLNQV